MKCKCFADLLCNNVIVVHNSKGYCGYFQVRKTVSSPRKRKTNRPSYQDQATRSRRVIINHRVPKRAWFVQGKLLNKARPQPGPKGGRGLGRTEQGEDLPETCLH